MVATTSTDDTSKSNSSITGTIFANNRAGPANLTAPLPSWDPTTVACPHGGGGALCIHPQKLGVNVTNNTIANNTGRFGGALARAFCCGCYREGSAAERFGCCNTWFCILLQQLALRIAETDGSAYCCNSWL
jgi:hypothetical protein